MHDQPMDTSQRWAAVMGGLGIVCMAVMAGFAYGVVFGSLVVPDNPVATADLITAAPLLFRGGILAWLVIFLLDVLVAWGLYLFFRPQHPGLSLLAAWLRLMYTIFLGAGLLCLFCVPLLLSPDHALIGLDLLQRQTLAFLCLQAFLGIWAVGLVVFGFHLLCLGYLALFSRNIPRFLSILLLIAGAGYILVNSGKVFFGLSHGFFLSLETWFVLPMVVAELGLGIWLLSRGGRPVADR